MALGIDRRLDGCDLTVAGAPLWLAASVDAPGERELRSTTRIGIAKEADRILRFFARDDPHVSGTTRQNATAVACGSDLGPSRRT